MGRPSGSRNPGYEERRTTLATAVLPRLCADDGPRASLADLAEAAGVSVPTMKHYFGDRSGVVGAALRLLGAQGTPWLAIVAVPSSPDPTTSLTTVAQALASAWAVHGVGRVFGAALAAGIHDDVAGPGMVDGLLEPTVAAIEQHLGILVDNGALTVSTPREVELRAAALAFISPLLVALLHQHELSGRACRPLDVDDFIARHVARFVRAWS